MSGGEIKKAVGLLGVVLLTALLARTPEPVRKSEDARLNVVKISRIGIPALFVKGGTFDMGEHFGEGKDDEKPVHSVTLSDFYIGLTEVTIGQYKNYCRLTGKAMPEQEDYTDDSYPVVFVTWYEANEFCQFVGGSLPTEAQWEYAARSGGLVMKYPSGEEMDHSMANYSGVEKKDKWKKAAPVASFAPNLLGLFDMSGNVYEWCHDYYKSDYYENSTMVEPTGPAASMFKVIRGGSWYHGTETLHTSHRMRYMPVARLSFLGFRVAWAPGRVQLAQ